jgi:hypothetical protein
VVCCAGRTVAKKYNPKKPIRYHIRMYGLGSPKGVRWVWHVWHKLNPPRCFSRGGMRCKAAEGVHACYCSGPGDRASSCAPLGRQGIQVFCVQGAVPRGRRPGGHRVDPPARHKAGAYHLPGMCAALLGVPSARRCARVLVECVWSMLTVPCCAVPYCVVVGQLVLQRHPLPVPIGQWFSCRGHRSWQPRVPH